MKTLLILTSLVLAFSLRAQVNQAHLRGTTNNVQDQLNQKLPLSGGTIVGSLFTTNSPYVWLNGTNVWLEARGALKLITPGVFAGSAGNGQALILVDDSDGTVEFGEIADATKLPLTGGTLSGNLSMGSTNRIINLGAPTGANDATTKTYVDAADNARLLLTGGTLTGNLSLNGTNRVTGLGTPTATNDATTKAYVDAIQAEARRGTFGGIPGLDFDGGTSGTRVTTDMTPYSFGTNDLTVWARTRIVPTLSLARTLWVFSSDSGTTPIQANSLTAYLTSGGDLTVRIHGSTTSDSRTATISGFATTYSGLVTDIVVTRKGATLKIYVNGTDTSYTETTAGTAPAWSGSVTATFAHIGASTTLANVYNSSFHRFVVWNRALSQTGVTSLMANGVDPADTWAVSTAVYSSDFASAITGWIAAGSVTLNNTAGTLTIIYPPSTLGGAIYNATTLTRQKNHRISFTARLVSGSFNGAANVRDSGSSSGFLSISDTVTTFTPSATVQTISFDITAQSASGASRWMYLQGLSTASGATLEIDDFQLTRIGAFIDYDFSSGVGWQVHDLGTNKEHGMLFGGASWRVPRNRGLVYGELTASGQTLTGTTSVPTDAIIESIIVENVSAGSGALISLGSSAGTPTDILSALPLGPNGSRNIYQPLVGTSTGNLYFTYTTSGTLRVTVIYTRLF